MTRIIPAFGHLVLSTQDRSHWSGDNDILGMVEAQKASMTQLIQCLTDCKNLEDGMRTYGPRPSVMAAERLDAGRNRDGIKQSETEGEGGRSTASEGEGDPVPAW